MIVHSVLNKIQQPSKIIGTVQIPVDSVHATSGGRKMVITHEIHWIDHHRTPQRQHHEVYQTP
jgi:hypothetical protein